MENKESSLLANGLIKSVLKEQAIADILKYSIELHENELTRLSLLGGIEAHQYKQIERKLIDLRAERDKQEKFREIKQIERGVVLRHSEPEKISNTDTIFKYDPEMILRVYEFLINEMVYDCEDVAFFNAVKTGNFRSIIPLQSSKTKIKDLIYHLQSMGGLGEKWYTKAVKSIGVSKKHCSNLNVADEWRVGLEAAIKPKKINNLNKYT